MPFVNREVDFSEFMEELHKKIQTGGNPAALAFFESFLQEQLPQELKRRAAPEWDGRTVVAGDFDVLYPMAADILLDAATMNASEAHPTIYEEASAVSLALCQYLNELFQCSGDEGFDFIPIKSYSSMMAEAGYIEIHDGKISLTPAGIAAAQEVEEQIEGLKATGDFPLSQGLADGTYWQRTDLVEEAGMVPTCCGEPMTAEDDHGRFTCWKCGKTVAV